MSAFRTGRFAQLTAWSALLLCMALCGVMGLNAMDPKRRADVVLQALESTRQRVDVRRRLDPIFSVA
jgi:hypothetical protein